MEYYGEYYCAKIENDIDYEIFEPLLLLLNVDYKGDALNLRIYIEFSKNDNNHDFRIKLVGRLMGIKIFLSCLYKRIPQIYELRSYRYLIVYKEFKHIFNPKKGTLSNNL